MLSKLLSVAEGEIGYLEKESLKDLDSKKGNPGYNNYTKYWRDLYPQLQGQSWCDAFVGWCFYKAFGKEEANALLCGGLFSFYTPTSATLFKDAGRWSKDPAIGAQVFFDNGTRIYHTGIVDSFDEKYIRTIEGNTSSDAGVVANGGAVCRKAYLRTDSKIAGYGVPKWRNDMIYTTPTKWIAAVRKVYLDAYNGHYKYGDSKAMPPTSDHVISCDRLVAKACWDLGWTNQPKVGETCGITVYNMEEYLLKWGWTKITKQSDLEKGDVVLMRRNGQSKPTAAWHTFVLTAYDPKTQICSKYDEGSDSRIIAKQPFTGPLNEWVGTRSFYCGFRCPQKKSLGKYEISTAEVRSSSEGSHVKLMQLLLRGRGYVGKDKKNLKADGVAGTNTIYALKNFQKKHNLSVTGICDRKTWNKLSGRKTTDA